MREFFTSHRVASLAAAAGVLVVVATTGTLLMLGRDTASPAASSRPSGTPAATSTATPAPTPVTTPATTLLTTPPAPTTRNHPASTKPADDPEEPAVQLRDLGWITAVTGSADGDLRITYDRVIWLSGEAAERYHGGGEAPDGFVIVNDNPLLRTVRVAPEATFSGVDSLGLDDNSASAEPITREQFVTLARASLARGWKPLVHLQHAGPGNSDVVAVNEQYLP